MIIIGLGANLKYPKLTSLRETCGAAIKEMDDRGLKIQSYSSWYQSPPWPPSDQPWYVNGACSIITKLSPIQLLNEILSIEQKFGRERSKKNAARTLDLDILIYHDVISDVASDPILPHPRISERAFALYPIRDVAANWCHPTTGESIDELILALPNSTEIRKMPKGKGAYGTEWMAPT
jgi:2-amino-4-hydroxy-6-hydroxymethyldihydropteridine diphosphokinase